MFSASLTHGCPRISVPRLRSRGCPGTSRSGCPGTSRDPWLSSEPQGARVAVQHVFVQHVFRQPDAWVSTYLRPTHGTPVAVQVLSPSGRMAVQVPPERSRSHGCPSASRALIDQRATGSASWVLRFPPDRSRAAARRGRFLAGQWPRGSVVRVPAPLRAIARAVAHRTSSEFGPCRSQPWIYSLPAINHDMACQVRCVQMPYPPDLS